MFWLFLFGGWSGVLCEGGVGCLCVYLDGDLCCTGFEGDGAVSGFFGGDGPSAVAVVVYCGRFGVWVFCGDGAGGSFRQGGYGDFHWFANFASDVGWCGDDLGDRVFRWFDGAGGLIVVAWRVEVKFAYDHCAFWTGGHGAGEGDDEGVAEADFEFSTGADEGLRDAEVLCAGVAVADVVDDDVAWRVADAFVAAESDLAGFSEVSADDAFEFCVVVEFGEQHAEEAYARTDDVKFEAHFVVAAVWYFDGA